MWDKRSRADLISSAMAYSAKIDPKRLEGREEGQSSAPRSRFLLGLDRTVCCVCYTRADWDKRCDRIHLRVVGSMPSARECVGVGLHQADMCQQFTANGVLPRHYNSSRHPNPSPVLHMAEDVQSQVGYLLSTRLSAHTHEGWAHARRGLIS